jgi:large subunit ribosomal protein L10
MRLTIIPKQETVQEIKNNFKNSKAVIFWNYRYVDSEKFFDLKKRLKKVESFSKVYKITLTQRALEDKQILDFKQPIAFIFCQGDEYQPLQVLNNFEQEYYREESNNKLEKIKGGWYEKKFVSPEVLQQWAKLPSKKELLQVFCHYLQWNLRKLTSLLHSLVAIKEKEC